MNEHSELTISSFIRILSEIEKTEGDLPIWVMDSMGWEMPLFDDGVEVMAATMNEPKRISL